MRTLRTTGMSDQGRTFRHSSVVPAPPPWAASGQSTHAESSGATSWPVAAPVAPSPATAPARVVVERTPLRASDFGGRSQPPPARESKEKTASSVKPPGTTPSASANGSPLPVNESALEAGFVQPDESTTPPRTPAAGAPPAPPPCPRYHGEIGREMLRRPAKQPPRSGWRWLVWVLTFGLVNLGESPADVRRAQLAARPRKASTLPGWGYWVTRRGPGWCWRLGCWAITTRCKQWSVGAARPISHLCRRRQPPATLISRRRPW